MSAPVDRGLSRADPGGRLPTATEQRIEMASYQGETLEQRLSRLLKTMDQAKATGHDGEMLAQRIEGDLHRLMNSAWLNCSDLIQRHERQCQSRMPEAANAAMEYAVTANEGQSFLKLWHEGNFDAIRKGWPDAPETIYVDRKVFL